jgi:hypothetical protein
MRLGHRPLPAKSSRSGWTFRQRPRADAPPGRPNDQPASTWMVTGTRLVMMS